MEEKVVNINKQVADYTLVYKALGGRPRERDRQKIASDLIEWAKKENSLNLNAFAAEQGISVRYLHIWAKEDEGFQTAYEFAKQQIAARREEALRLGNLHVKAYDLNARVYDEMIFCQWKIEKEFEKRLDLEIENAKSENDKGRLAEQLQAIKESLLRKSNDST